MKKIIALTIAAGIAASSMAVAVTSAEARPGVRGHYKSYSYRRGRGNAVAGAAVAAGAAALIGGAIAANANRHAYYDDPGYGYRSYGPAPYGYDGY